jgi:hypothetical protein
MIFEPELQIIPSPQFLLRRESDKKSIIAVGQRFPIPIGPNEPTKLLLNN